MMQVLRTLEEELARAETTLIVANSNAEPEREARLVRILREEGVAGLIIAPADEAPEPLGGLVRAGFPITVIDRTMPFEVDTVRTRNFDAATAAVGHLVGLGHRRIGFIGGPHRLSSARDRHAGFRRGLSEAGPRPRPSMCVLATIGMESGRRLAATLTDLSDAPTSVLVANNEMVIGALNHIHAVGMTIPDDLAIVGFDDFPWSISLNPPLTAIAQPVDEIGRTAARLILDRIADPGRPASIVELPAELVVRASCGTGRELRRLKKTEPTREIESMTKTGMLRNALAVLVTTVAFPALAEETLTIAIAGDIETIDPLFSQFQRANEVNYNILDQFFRYGGPTPARGMRRDTTKIEGSSFECVGDGTEDKTVLDPGSPRR